MNSSLPFSTFSPDKSHHSTHTICKNCPKCNSTSVGITNDGGKHGKCLNCGLLFLMKSSDESATFEKMLLSIIPKPHTHTYLHTMKTQEERDEYHKKNNYMMLEKDIIWGASPP